MQVASLSLQLQKIFRKNSKDDLPEETGKGQ